MSDTQNGVKIELSSKTLTALLTALLSAIVGFSFYGGTPNQTRDAVIAQTDTLSSSIHVLERKIDINTGVILANSLRISDVEQDASKIMTHADSLHDVTTKMIINLEGYFKGQMDARGN